MVKQLILQLNWFNDMEGRLEKTKSAVIKYSGGSLQQT